MSSTSMATPHVAGGAALVWSYNQYLSAAEVKEALLKGVDTIPSLSEIILTEGRLNVHKALDEALPPWFSVLPMGSGELNPYEEHLFTVTVNPENLLAGQWEGLITITTNDPAHQILTLEVIADINSYKSLSVSPTSVDFGYAWVNHPSLQIISK